MVARQELDAKKKAYNGAIEERSHAQMSINNLLQRKSQWNSKDIENFTSLCQSEHELLNLEKVAKEELHQGEVTLENLQLIYDSILRERYQEEIILGERNKGMSNILTWGLLLLNTCIFVYSQLVTEPQRGRRVGAKVDQIIVALQRPIAEIDSSVKQLLDMASATNSAPSSSSSASASALVESDETFEDGKGNILKDGEGNGSFGNPNSSLTLSADELREIFTSLPSLAELTPRQMVLGITTCLSSLLIVIIVATK